MCLYKISYDFTSVKIMYSIISSFLSHFFSSFSAANQKKDGLSKLSRLFRRNQHSTATSLGDFPNYFNIASNNRSAAGHIIEDLHRRGLISILTMGGNTDVHRSDIFWDLLVRYLTSKNKCPLEPFPVYLLFPDSRTSENHRPGRL